VIFENTLTKTANTAPDSIRELVNRFDAHRDSYHSGRYNETQLRRDFLDPFFKALGWDIDNAQGYAEAYRDVIHEDAIKIGGVTKAPDYSFRVGGMRKFFVEAKKPSVDIKDQPASAFQLRRYAWSAKLPLSILSDFEELAIYDCRTKPVKTDKASHGRIAYYTYKDYIEKWNEIASVFSRESILRGSFDKYAERAKDKRGTEEVDDAFLKEIEKWRDLLAKNIALHSNLSQRELNFAVQVTIDRLVFLRICEDRGIESYGRLLGAISGAGIYGRLQHHFREADDRYNSGLFHFQSDKEQSEAPDNLTLGLSISDHVLKEILSKLYYPDSPYEFSVLSADILGQVYEQFLGKVIRLTEGHQAKIEEKPEVRKAGGVYYTPAYIVQYIVENTVGKLVKGKSPKEITNLKVLDPACGSGSFLLGAYQFLLDWHLKYYTENEPIKWKKQLCQGFKGDWRLTTSERKRILLNNIFGVDIDAQAVEVTKLSLLLKVLEGETEVTLGQQLSMFKERALPNLGDNIKCGNSLIGPEFYNRAQQDLFTLDDDQMFRINVFDWETAFPQIFQRKNIGFDVVIGNPPYTSMISKAEQEFFSEHYHHQDYQKDLYLLFLERYSHLLKESGCLGIIVSNTWLQSVTLRKIRKHLSTIYHWERLLHLPEKVFKAIVDTHVLIFVKSAKSISGSLVVDVRKGSRIEESHTLAWKNISKTGDPINVLLSQDEQQLFEKIRSKSVLLEQICNVFNGVKPFEKGKGMPLQTEQIMEEQPYVREGPRPQGVSWLPLLRGSLIRRYENLWDENYWISYGPWLAAPRDRSIFDALQKIMVRQTGDSIIATLVGKDVVARNNLHILLPKSGQYDLRYLLGILNSRLMDFAYTAINPEKGEALAEVKKRHVENLPIAPINFNQLSEKRIHDQMVHLVDQMLLSHKKIRTAKTPHEQESLQRQIEAIRRQIDQLVYGLYGLSEEDRKIIEQHE
jgi:type I restriction-modification system DNA methylase subunit